MTCCHFIAKQPLNSIFVLLSWPYYLGWLTGQCVATGLVVLALHYAAFVVAASIQCVFTPSRSLSSLLPVGHYTSLQSSTTQRVT
jgi:hypothetical protein